VILCGAAYLELVVEALHFGVEIVIHDFQRDLSNLKQLANLFLRIIGCNIILHDLFTHVSVSFDGFSVAVLRSQKTRACKPLFFLCQ
jgi:hypothetical protein